MKHRNPTLLACRIEKTWFLGTDILDDQDLEYIETEFVYSMTCEYASILDVKKLLENSAIRRPPYMLKLLKEARNRGYEYIFFDRNIETNIKHV